MAKVTSLCDEPEGFPLTFFNIQKTSQTGSVCSALKFSGRSDISRIIMHLHDSYLLSVRTCSAHNACQRIEVVIRYRLFVNLPQRQDKSPPLPSRLNGEQETWHRQRKKRWRELVSGSTVRHSESFLSSLPPESRFFCLSGWSILASQHQTDALNLLFRKKRISTSEETSNEIHAQIACWCKSATLGISTESVKIYLAKTRQHYTFSAPAFLYNQLLFLLIHFHVNGLRGKTFQHFFPKQDMF